MSGDLDAIVKSMAVDAVPGSWEKAAYPSLKPLGAWCDDLVARLEFMQGWIAGGIPQSFWISGM